MYLLPYDSFQIESPLPLDETVNLLKSRVEPRRLWRFPGSIHREFEGRVTKTKFRITRIIRGRDAFLPLVTGQFEPASSGTIIQIRMGLRPAVTLSIIVFLGVVGFDLVKNFVSGNYNSAPVSSWIYSVFMLILIIAVPLGSFWYSATPQKNQLIEIFEGG